jgi:Cu/Ag efflux protein CusF
MRFHLLRFPHLVAVLALSVTAQAQQPPSRAAAPASTAARSMPLADGEVLEVDRRERTVLMKHGPIASLGMDAMTMEFVVRDAPLLAAMKPGDKVRFATVYQDGDYVLTYAERVQRRRVAPRK